MKVLWVITGIGLGHAIRDHEIIKKLGCKIEIGTYGDSYEYFKNKYDCFRIPYIP